MIKQEIRKNIREQKSRLSFQERETYSNLIIKKLTEQREYQRASEVFCYISFNQEVITSAFIEEALSGRKRIAVPKITGDGMKFYYISSLKNLKPGVLGILEPDTRNEEAVPKKGNENLIIVPGLAFDLLGNRIGYGKGYYDAFFGKYKDFSWIKTALAYDFQILPKLPAEEHDIKVDHIITQSGLIK
ncbi:5-formyltetrahydrofolate cyclo-ligase [Anaerocolumna sp. AGMB13025]|uniref:5-formyltetrahydrofolate cyclo-ligase n=1 Tax=Anaerocolumna sp. AGMB13025 TaxID=3039116 RepID=UPI00241DDF7D|nr:5-formyltetrahydrofolate cyclo-ligase [Anaerocolumna sp. AGMB13025]WFR60008.1 5-formyltetrahydrofolate cyclo-ligase [Anaerocolumna sp. AGMB13025]